ncbi:hypothetical protein KP78_04050 [Jeotgalibacillus soli]|uniref:Uncharacterized protein n=1 Tax=Jeotgalibacillus soli TaxID=889306 RepID=A0A0C2RP74_9BACL|nr:hypothetical protein KP78_04050 [Jeotgalibacillus soli]
MKKYRILFIFIFFLALLLVGAIIYSFLRDSDPYNYFTGIAVRLLCHLMMK